MKRTIIDLTEEESNDTSKVSLGFENGTIRVSQSSRTALNSQCISFDEILNKNGLQRCLFTSYVYDIDWLMSKIGNTETILCVDGGRELAGKIQKKGKLTVVFPKFPRFPQYGVMHGKLMLLWYPEFLRVVISSGNLAPYDYDLVQNVNFESLRNNNLVC